MTIFQFEGLGSGAGFTTQMAFQSLNQGGGEFALPPGHIATPAARNAANNVFPLLVARPCTLVQVSIAAATAAAGAIIVATRTNGGKFLVFGVRERTGGAVRPIARCFPKLDGLLHLVLNALGFLLGFAL